MKIAAIETRYAGCRFRSRLEARWAVFFDHLSIRWEYEPQGFAINGHPYLPDFLLPECDTWIEVKGAEEQLDRDLMFTAAKLLPQESGHLNGPGPSLMILGPIPQPPTRGDWYWTGFHMPHSPFARRKGPKLGRYGFGLFHYLFGISDPPRPWDLCAPSMDMPWLTPVLHPYDADVLNELDARPITSELRAPYAVNASYIAARSARFEHGEQG